MKRKITLIIIYSLILISLTGCGNSKEDNNKSAESISNDLEVQNEETETNYKQAYDVIGVAESTDNSLFKGILYDADGKEYSVNDIEEDRIDGTYYFSDDETMWRKQETYIKQAMEILGKPTTILQEYDSGVLDKYTGTVFFIWNYGSYYLVIEAYDFTNWEGYSYDYYKLEATYLVKDVNEWGLNWLFDPEKSDIFEVYGEIITLD